MRQKEAPEKTHAITSASWVFVARDNLYQRSDTMRWVDQFAALFLTFEGSLETRWGKCAVGSQGKYVWAAWSWTAEPLSVLVRRLLSCFIERSPQHLSSLTIWFHQGRPRDLNAPPVPPPAASYSHPLACGYEPLGRCIDVSAPPIILALNKLLHFSLVSLYSSWLLSNHRRGCPAVTFRAAEINIVVWLLTWSKTYRFRVLGTVLPAEIHESAFSGFIWLTLLYCGMLILVAIDANVGILLNF